MALLEWDDKFSVSVQVVDEQHQKLFSLVNALHDAMRVGKGRDVLETVLSELIDYTVYHFSTEEKLFAQNDYPHMIEHKKEHADLTNQARDIKAKFEKGEMLITVEVLNFLTKWLNDHILGSDKRFGAFLNHT